MLEIQFELPDIEHKSKYVVDAAVVKGERLLFDRNAITATPGGEKKSA